LASVRASPMLRPPRTDGEAAGCSSPGNSRRQSGGSPPSVRRLADQSSRGVRKPLKSAPASPRFRLLGAAPVASEGQARAYGAGSGEDGGDQSQDPGETIALR